MLFGLFAIMALVADRWGWALPMPVLALAPNLVWSAARHEDRVATCLGGLRTVWRIGQGRQRRSAGPRLPSPL